MSEPPRRYLYLVDLSTSEAIAICPLDGLHPLEIIAVEAKLRVEAGVDDPQSNLAIRDSELAPLPAEDLAWAWKTRQR